MANIIASDLILIVLAIFLPPISAILTDGCGAQFCINVILTILGFIPGLIHAIWLIYRQADRRELAGGAPGYNGRRGKQPHYVVVNQPGQPQQGYPQQGHAPPPEAVYPAQPVQQAVPQHYGHGGKI